MFITFDKKLQDKMLQEQEVCITQLMLGYNPLILSQHILFSPPLLLLIFATLLVTIQVLIVQVHMIDFILLLYKHVRKIDCTKQNLLYDFFYLYDLYII